MDVLQTLGIDWRLLLAQLVNFAILLIVLKKFLYKPVMDALEKRSAAIEKSLRDAQIIEERLKETERQRVQIIQKTQKQAEEILEHAHTAAEQKQQMLLDKARAEVKLIVEQAREKIDSEKRQMITDAKREVVDLVMKGIHAILDDILSKDVSREYTTKAIEKIKQKVSA